MPHPQTPDDVGEFLSAYIARNQLLLAVGSYQPTSQLIISPQAAPESPQSAGKTLHMRAVSESYHRVPETCPALHAGGVNFVASFIEWIDTRFAEQLPEAARLEIITRTARQVSELLEIAKGAGTLPLRAALVREIETRLSPSAPQAEPISSAV